MAKPDLWQLAVNSGASQDKWELWQLLRYAAELKPKVIVEIGVDGGGSLRTWEAAFPAALVLGIEANHTKRPELSDLNVVFGRSAAGATVDELKTILRHRPIDVLFIDGDHSFAAVKRDYQLYEPLVRPGGIIAFHDTNARGLGSVEVSAFMKELDINQSFTTVDLRRDRQSPGTRVMWK